MHCKLSCMLSTSSTYASSKWTGNRRKNCEEPISGFQESWSLEGSTYPKLLLQTHTPTNIVVSVQQVVKSEECRPEPAGYILLAAIYYFVNARQADFVNKQSMRIDRAMLECSPSVQVTAPPARLSKQTDNNNNSFQMQGPHQTQTSGLLSSK